MFEFFNQKMWFQLINGLNYEPPGTMIQTMREFLLCDIGCFNQLFLISMKLLLPTNSVRFLNFIR